MAPPSNEVSFIIVLGIVISVFLISSILLCDSYHVCFKQNSKQRRTGANQTSWISLKQMCPISLLSDGIPDGISNSTSDTISETIPKTISVHMEAISEAIPEFNSDHSHCSTPRQETGLWERLCEAVSKHLSSEYIAHVNLSISRLICMKIVLGCDVCNCSSTVDSIFYACYQWPWIGEHMRDSRDADPVQEMWDLCESHAAYSKGILLGISCGLGSRLLFSRSPVDRSSQGDDQSTCGFIVIQASSIVRIDITFKCSISFSSETQTPVLCTVEVSKYGFESYHMLIARVLIVPAETSDGIGDIGPCGGHSVHESTDHRLVYGRIACFFVGLPLLKLHRHWHGTWSGLIHFELCQDHPNIAVPMDVDRVMLPIAFDHHAKIEGDTPVIMHPESLLHPIVNLPN